MHPPRLCWELFSVKCTPLRIKPGNVQLNAEHYCWREIFIRLPQEVTWNAIHEHPDEVWRLVQQNPNVSLRALDRVWLMAHDESELASGIVCVATGTKVVLSGFKKHTYGGRDTAAEWADEIYSVKWDGLGFAVHRKKDGVRMMQSSFATIEVADGEIH